MKLLNLCAGATRPGDPWVNIDNLHDDLLPGTPERANLDKETNYVNADVLCGLPFSGETFDGVLGSHCLEHWDCKRGLKVMQECHRVLKPEGILMISVPNAHYFRENHELDNIENAITVFGEPIHLPDGHKTFFAYALWNRYHQAIMSEDTLWAYFRRAGFPHASIKKISPYRWYDEDPMREMHSLLNRRNFSLIMIGTK